MARPPIGPSGGPPPGGGFGPCTSAPGCDCAVRAEAHKGDPQIFQLFSITNPFPNPITFTGVKLETDHPELWKVDTSGLKGTLQPGQEVLFSVTFTPPPA